MKTYDEISPKGIIYKITVKPCIIERRGKKYLEYIKCRKKIKKIWKDNYRSENKLNPTEKAPTFKTEEVIGREK